MGKEDRSHEPQSREYFSQDIAQDHLILKLTVAFDEGNYREIGGELIRHFMSRPKNIRCIIIDLQDLKMITSAGFLGFKDLYRRAREAQIVVQYIITAREVWDRFVIMYQAREFPFRGFSSLSEAMADPLPGTDTPSSSEPGPQ